MFTMSVLEQLEFMLTGKQQEKLFLSVLISTDYSVKVNKYRILSLFYLILF